MSALERGNKGGELKLYVERAATGVLLWSSVRVVDLMWETVCVILYTGMRRLTTGILSEQCVFRRFRCCGNVM